MSLKEKLKALGFEEVYEHGEYLKRDLDLYVYIRYNKIKSVQLSKVWISTPTNYDNYLEEVRNILEQLNDIQ